MKKPYAFIIAFALSVSLVFSQTPWSLHLEEVKSKAASGDPDAQGILSVYIQTQGVRGTNGEALTNGEAFSLAEKSANAVSAFGIYALGRCYEKAIGTAKNEAKAKNLYSEALPHIKEKADQGSGIAQSLLGNCYENGRGVPKDEAEAVKWYRKAAEQGNAQAQTFLGQCYSDGIGVPKNDEEAVKWYRKAAEQGSAAAKVLLGGRYLVGNGVAKDAAKSLRLLLEGYNSLDVNDPKALGVAFLIGALYDGELPGVENGEEASKWLQKVVDSGGENADEARRRLQKYKIYNAVNQLQQEAAKYLEKVEDETPNPIAGPPKQIVVTYMWGICKAGEVQSNDKSFTLQRGNTLRSTGFKGIPIGVELYPIRISGSQLQMTYYFYQDEFGDWKGVEK